MQKDKIALHTIEKLDLSSGMPRIREPLHHAVVSNRDGEIVDRFQTFVDPERHLTPEIIAKTGITDQMLQGQ